MKMQDKTVESSDDMNALIVLLKQAGRAHRSYGVRKSEHGKVADSLFWTLEEGLGEAFDKPTQDAWEETFATVSGFMIEGAGYDNEPDHAKVEKRILL